MNYFFQKATHLTYSMSSFPFYFLFFPQLDLKPYVNVKGGHPKMTL